MAEDSSEGAASSPPQRWTFDVFLSFRGETRLGFTDHLHFALQSKGFIVFRDEEKLERGGNIRPELLKAVKESEYAIVVISKNYAFSTWCLDELTEIVRRKKERKLKVLPVFYQVDPSDIRKQKGSFGMAFAKHVVDHVDENRRKKWRDALEEVCSISGWDIRGRHESEVVEEICRKISYELSRQMLKIDDDLVGIESRIKELMTLLRIRGDDVRFIGICGMGGIGKTTIAEVIYSKIFSRFEADCFISNVREESQKSRNLLPLQKELISQIFGEKEPKIRTTFQGRNLIASRAKDKKVFIVLDDVDKEDQLEELVRKHSWFGEGSRVLVTSRDGHLLTRYVDEIYEVKKLNCHDALQLFNLKAFNKGFCEGNFEVFLEDILKYAGGLPLALKIFGSYLFGCTIDAWRSALDRLKVDPGSNILDILKISFKGLDNIQQNLFLDIACFFKGGLVEDVIYKLEALGRFPKNDIPILESKSLIKISDDYRVKMHDLIQEMGHQIVYHESPREPSKRSRLWHWKDIVQVLKNNTETNAIESIVLELPLPKPVKLSLKGFSRIKKLKMLMIHPKYGLQAIAYETLKNLDTVQWYEDPSKLKFNNELCVLEWWGFPFEHFPSNFDLNNLVFLKMPMSYIKQPWDGRKTLDKLKYVDLRHSQILIEALDFSKVPNLEVFNVKGSTLIQLQSSIAFPKEHSILPIGGSYSNSNGFWPSSSNPYLRSLVKLNLGYCNIMDGELPHNLGCLSTLEYLYLSGNKFTELPNSISKLPNLRTLELLYCDQLRTLPHSIFQLSKLDRLMLNHCARLQTSSKLPLCLKKLGVDLCQPDTFYDPIDASTSNVKLLTGDSSIMGFYFGYEGRPYCSLHMVNGIPDIKIAWGPTLESEVPEWFNQRSTTSSGTNQCLMTIDRQAAVSLVALAWQRALNWPREFIYWQLALFIVYEIHEPDNCERKRETQKAVEHGSSSSRIFDWNNSTHPVFVCEMEDKAGRSTGPITFRVPEVLPFGRNGFWLLLMNFPFDRALKGATMKEIKVSVTTSSLNVEVKECGARVVPRDDSVFYPEALCNQDIQEVLRNHDFREVLRSISPRGLDVPDLHNLAGCIQSSYPRRLSETSISIQKNS